MIARRTAVALAGALLALSCLEVAVRVIAAFDRNYLDEVVSPRRLKASGDLTLGDLIRVSGDDSTAYELRPSVHGRFIGEEVSINSLGIRGPERSTDKPPGSFRILGLGDSYAFGWGVKYEETFLAVLEAELARGHPERKVEVWNLAVPGYNTVQEVATYARWAPLLDPDLVVINFVDNDMEAPDFLRKRPNLWTLRRSFLRELLRRRRALGRGRDIAPTYLEGIGRPGAGDRAVRLGDDLREEYRALSGWENMLAAFDRLAASAREKGIPSVLLLNPDDYGAVLRGESAEALSSSARAVADHCRAAGYRVVDPEARIARYLREKHLGDLSLWISAGDPHPSALRHRLVAEELALALDPLLRAGGPQGFSAR